jgi:hypothetical protein
VARVSSRATLGYIEAALREIRPPSSTFVIFVPFVPASACPERIGKETEDRRQKTETGQGLSA